MLKTKMSPQGQTYDYELHDSLNNDVPDTWTLIAKTEIPSRDPGVYEVKLMFNYTFNSTNTSAFARFDINGQTVATGEREPKDKSDVEVKDFFKIFEHQGGPVVMELYAMKETADHTLNFGYADMALERKG